MAGGTVVKLPKLTKDECICVVWRDIQNDCKWMSREELELFHSAEAKSLGFFQCIRDGDLILKQSIIVDYEGDVASDGMAIPVGCIIRVRRLKIR